MEGGLGAAGEDEFCGVGLGEAAGCGCAYAGAASCYEDCFGGELVAEEIGGEFGVGFVVFCLDEGSHGDEAISNVAFFSENGRKWNGDVVMAICFRGAFLEGNMS